MDLNSSTGQVPAAQNVSQHSTLRPSDGVCLTERRGSSNWRVVWEMPVGKFMARRDDGFAALGTALARIVGRHTADHEVILSFPALSAQGFDIELRIQHDDIVVTFGGHEREFANTAHALIWVRRAVSDAYCLRSVFVGNRPQAWSLEPVGASAGGEDSLVSEKPVLFAGLWPKRVVYRQNAQLLA